MTKDRNSMCYWWPLVMNIEDVPKPETVLVSVDDSWTDLLLVGEGTRKLSNLFVVEAMCEELGFPLFARTDQMASKHCWDRTCFIPDEKSVGEHIANLVDHTLNCDMVGRPVCAIVLRKYIEMDSAFRAFDGLPISRERRYFAKDGEVICHHPYWPEKSIDFIIPKYPEPPDWQEKLAELSKEPDDEVELLTSYTETIGKALGDYWSIDFCRAEDGTWYFIDCALGEASWHPECDKNLEP